MKRLKFHRAIVAIAMMLIGWLPTLAQDFEVNGIRYYIKSSNNEAVVSYKLSTECEYGEDVRIPEYVRYNGIKYSVTTIGVRAFDNCTSLKYVEIPKSIISIYENAFSRCTSLTNVLLPNSVKSIEYYAFGQSGLTDITIPSSVETMGSNVFYSCEHLTNVVWNAVNCNDFEYDSKEHDYPPFHKCTNIRTFVFGDNVNHIPSHLCRDMKQLINIKIPNSVTSIGGYAFKGCSGLTEIKIPNSVTSIGYGAFHDCASLSKITCLASTPPDIHSIFLNYDIELYVPEGCKSAYQLADGWKNFTNIIELNENDKYSRLSIDGFNINAGGTKELTIELDNDVPFTGFQADLYLPSGLEVVAEDGNYSFELTDRKGSNHVLSAVKQSNGAIRLLCYSLTNKEFIGNEGALVKFSVKASDDFVGEHEISIKDIEFTQKDETKYELESTTTKVEGRMVAKSITLNKTEIALEATQTTTLIATVLPDNTYNKVVIWKSSDETIATVDENGKVTAIKVGEATITATTTDGTNLSASCKVIVNPTLATSITLDKTEVELEATQTATLVATVLPELTTNKAVTWASSNDEVAIVDENGVVTAIAVGETTITATTNDGSNLSASCKVTVKPTLATSITLDMTEVELEATQTATLVATVLPELTTNKSVTWKSSDESIAIVDKNGVITAIAVGEVTITATTTDGSNLSASCKVIVKPTQATSITLNKTEASLKVTETITLVATVLPELTTDKSVTWKSSNNAVATVSENGVVTAVATGEAIITATTTDGSNLSASAKIIVDPTLAESVTLNIDKVTLKANETIELTATVLPELCTNKSVAWQSSDDKVAVVDANGLVTAIGVGEATITATTTDGSNLSATCTITVEATPGDANNDGNVNVTDVITVASHILGFNPNPFIFDAADINKDGKISITDIVAIVNIILNSETTNEVAHYARAAKQQAVGSSLFIEDCSIQEGETKTIAINLTNDITFSGFQADIKLPEGLELCQEDGEYMISLSDRKGNDHVLASAMRSNGSIRLLSYSMGLNEFKGTEGALVYLTVKAANNFVGDYEIRINNITFTQANLTEYSLEPTICHLTGTTGINDVDGEVIVATIGDNIIVKNAPLGSYVKVYASNGALIVSEAVTDGDVIVEAPIKGIYLVKVGKQTVKVII